MPYVMKYVTFAWSDYDYASLGSCMIEEGIRNADQKTRIEALYLDGCDNIKYATSAKGTNKRIRIIDSLILKGLGV
jgi:hypothetical protein